MYSNNVLDKGLKDQPLSVPDPISSVSPNVLIGEVDLAEILRRVDRIPT
jgi:hypothetical protein